MNIENTVARPKLHFNKEFETSDNHKATIHQDNEDKQNGRFEKKYKWTHISYDICFVYKSDLEEIYNITRPLIMEIDESIQKIIQTT